MGVDRKEVEEIIEFMKSNMEGELPRPAELASEIIPEMIIEHKHSRMFAMPKDGAIDNEHRILIYLGIALATGSTSCVKAMTNKAITFKISKEKILETFKIARYAEASRVFGNAEAMFEKLI